MRSKKLKYLARNLRKNMTDAEKLLWSKLRRKNLGVKFRRQEVIGKYIVDFVCYEKKIIVEVDGGQHAENPRDLKRERRLKTQGFKILRFWNNEVLKNIEGVIEVIKENLSPSPYPSHQGREKKENEIKRDN